MRRILWRNSYLSLLAVAACAAAASGAIYQWTGTGTGNDYTDPNNWCPADPCPTTYPDDNGDDAIFPVRPGANGVWGDVDLDFDGTTQIRDLTIKAGVDFKGHDGGTRPHLEAATLTIDATSDEVTITFNGKISLTANPAQ